MLARLGKRQIPVLDADRRMVVTFSGGKRGRREAGRYHFWTACGEDEYGPWTVFGRNRVRLPYGERLERLRRESILLWNQVKDAAYLRPTTLRELARWAASHKEDWAFLVKIEWRGRTYKRLPRKLR